MVRVCIPGFGLSLRVLATTNAIVYHHGVAHTETRDVELVSGERIPASAIKRIRYHGASTWVPPREARSVILWLSMIGGMNTKGLWELANLHLEALELEDQQEALVDDGDPQVVMAG